MFVRLMIMTSGTTITVRELTDAELSDVGGAMRIDFMGYTLFLESGDGWAYGCVADGERYGCVTTVGGKVYTSSGPVPH
jgi:hypothetical protein